MRPSLISFLTSVAARLDVASKVRLTIFDSPFSTTWNLACHLPLPRSRRLPCETDFTLSPLSKCYPVQTNLDFCPNPGQIDLY